MTLRRLLNRCRWSLAALAAGAVITPASAQDSAELAKQLSNPVAALISVPFQFNWDDVSSTFLQPFVSYTTPKAVTVAFNLESTYDWEREEWNIPANLMVAKVTRFGNQLVSVQGGLRYYLESTDSGPEGLGLRFAMTLLFPR